MSSSNLFENGHIAWGNNLSIMPEMPAGSIDLTVTSRPYDRIRTYNGAVDDYQFKPLAKELFRVTVDGGILIWNTADQRADFSLSGTSLRDACFFLNLGFKLLDRVFFVKNGLFNQYPNTLCQTVEDAFVFLKGDRPNVPDAYLIRDRENLHAGTLYHGTRRQINGDTKPRKKQVEQKYSKRTQVWEYNVGGGHSDVLVPFTHEGNSKQVSHPATMVDLFCADLVNCYSTEGSTVFDPMCGFGTTPAVAELFNRRGIGIEIIEEWAEASRQRVQTAIVIREHQLPQDALLDYIFSRQFGDEEKLFFSQIEEVDSE